MVPESQSKHIMIDGVRALQKLRNAKKGAKSALIGLHHFL